ncbi:MAG: hypothetical protein M5U01_11170 [Ardenticatenaceae bacterium]|nr:hypothetical protein [Ardenticatenaceae bacterium]HBY95640.1 hypothetical protein [Chloroflexota bacterium]
MMRSFRGTLRLVIVGVLLSACQVGPRAAVPTPTLTPPAAPTEGPVADPTASVAPLVIPTAAPERGVVHGLLRREVQETPINDVDLYLAEIIPGDSNVMRVAGLDTNAAPHAMTNTNGEFVFSDVEPGEYALALVTPIGSMLVPDPKTPGRDILFTLEAGQTLDLGTLHAILPY